jgi:hypothetical protein
LYSVLYVVILWGFNLSLSWNSRQCMEESKRDLTWPHGVQVTLSDPILSDGELRALQETESLKPATLPTFFDVSDGIEGALQRGLDKLCEAADEAVRSGSQLLILSDRTVDMVIFLRLHSSFYLVWTTLNRYSYITWDNCV